VELRLRHAGIRILTTKEERSRTPGAPYLYINVNVLLRPDRLDAFNITVELNQDASLKTDGSLATVATWSVGATGSVGNTMGLYFIRNSVRDIVDKFINAYLSVHPRPIGSATPSPTSPRRDLIRQVQERLQTVGFNPGSLDGAMGPQTQNALRWFQNAKGLRSTGDLDESTLNALGIR
jgi:Putative peptidoglycan binding domain